jgi:hypothetical protein
MHLPTFWCDSKSFFYIVKFGGELRKLNKGQLNWTSCHRVSGRGAGPHLLLVTLLLCWLPAAFIRRGQQQHRAWQRRLHSIHRRRRCFLSFLPFAVLYCHKLGHVGAAGPGPSADPRKVIFFSPLSIHPIHPSLEDHALAQVARAHGSLSLGAASSPWVNLRHSPRIISLQ